MNERPQHILIVDDEVTARKIIRFVLEQHGYQVSEATSGEEALEKAQQHQFDLVITDEVMPTTYGHELCRQLRLKEHYATTPIILMTAHARELDTRPYLKEFNLVTVMEKPFGPLLLCDTVQEALAS